MEEVNKELQNINSTININNIICFTFITILITSSIVLSLGTTAPLHLTHLLSDKKLQNNVIESIKTIKDKIFKIFINSHKIIDKLIKENNTNDLQIVIQSKSLIYINNVNNISLLFKYFFTKYYNILIEYESLNSNNTDININTIKINYVDYLFKYNILIALKKFNEAMNIETLIKINKNKNNENIVKKFAKYLHKIFNNENVFFDVFTQLNTMNIILLTISNFLNVIDDVKYESYTNNTIINKSKLISTQNSNSDSDTDIDNMLNNLYFSSNYYNIEENKIITQVETNNNLGYIYINNDVCNNLYEIIIFIKTNFDSKIKLKTETSTNLIDINNIKLLIPNYTKAISIENKIIEFLIKKFNNYSRINNINTIKELIDNINAKLQENTEYNINDINDIDDITYSNIIKFNEFLNSINTNSIAGGKYKKPKILYKLEKKTLKKKYKSRI